MNTTPLTLLFTDDMKLFQHSKLFLLTLVLVASFLDACRHVDSTSVEEKTAHDYDSKVYTEWNTVFMDLDRYAKGYRPGPGPRSLGYLGLAAYEAVVSAIPENRSLEFQFAGLDIPDVEDGAEYHWPAVVNAVYGYMMPRFFPHMEIEYGALYRKIADTEEKFHRQFGEETTTEILERSESYGEAVAKAVYTWSTTDPVGHNGFLNPQPVTYVPPVGPGNWQPTYPDFSRAVFPQWGGIRTFALRDEEKLARAPLAYSENPASLFYNQATEVFHTVNFIKENGADPGAYELRWIAEFWSDDILQMTFSPPTRQIAIVNQVVEIEKLDLAGSAELYAKVGMALNDTGAAIWHSKYHYNVERPVSYIRRVVSRIFPDAANWTTILNNQPAQINGVTPAFPAYPSGHSGFGGAGSKILSSFFEYTPQHPGTYAFTDRCHENRSTTEFLGTPRRFASFKDMADENAYSRVPLGVHFRMDCVEGLRLGELAAQKVLQLPWKK
jgi:membrane-associated phospholipid phosphatase